MIVTVDLFSGRPNPAWRLSDRDRARLLERLSGRALPAATEADTILGFRGFIVSASSDDEMPDTMATEVRIGGPMPAQAPAPEPHLTALSAFEWAEVSRFLLNTGRHVLDSDLATSLESLIQTQATPSPKQDAALWMEPAEPAPEEPAAGEVPSREAAAPEVLAALLPCVIGNTPYKPGFWNRLGVQGNHNCYNFAMNYRSDTFAQPGRISGHPLSFPKIISARSDDAIRTRLV